MLSIFLVNGLVIIIIVIILWDCNKRSKKSIFFAPYFLYVWYKQWDSSGKDVLSNDYIANVGGGLLIGYIIIRIFLLILSRRALEVNAKDYDNSG